MVVAVYSIMMLRCEPERRAAYIVVLGFQLVRNVYTYLFDVAPWKSGFVLRIWNMLMHDNIRICFSMYRPHREPLLLRSLPDS